MSQAIQQKVLSGLLVEKGPFRKEEFLEMVRVVNREIKRREKLS
jgi:hypothetical protein